MKPEVLFRPTRESFPIEQWGDIAWSSMSGAFYGCVNMDVRATDVPDLANVTSTSGMFRECSALLGNASFND